MRTQIFSYKGNLAAITDLKEGKFINNPTAPGELECIVSTSEIDITTKAKELIRNAKRKNNSFAEIMLTKHTDPVPHGKSSIRLMGITKHHFGKAFAISRDCELSVLDDCTETEIEIPTDYKEFIDSI